MKINIYKIFMLALIFNNISCGHIAILLHEECTTGSPYEFRLPIQYIPNKYEFSVGDTITVRFDFSDEMMDETEHKNYKLENFRTFLPTLRFIRFEQEAKQFDFFNYADTLDLQTNGMSISFFGDKDGGITYDYKYEANRYKASMSFILKKKGIYYFKHTSASYPEFSSAFEGKCNTRNVDIYFTHPYNTNFDLVKWLIYPKADPRAFEYFDFEMQFRRDGGYAFEVK